MFSRRLNVYVLCLRKFKVGKNACNGICLCMLDLWKQRKYSRLKGAQSFFLPSSLKLASFGSSDLMHCSPAAILAMDCMLHPDCGIPSDKQQNEYSSFLTAWNCFCWIFYKYLIHFKKLNWACRLNTNHKIKYIAMNILMSSMWKFLKMSIFQNIAKMTSG